MNASQTSHSAQGAQDAPGRKPQDASRSCGAGAAREIDSAQPCAWQPSQFDDIRLKPQPPRRQRKSRHRSGVRSKKNVREYSTGEEIANAITHGIGAGLAVAAIPITVVTAVSHGAGVLLAAALIYSISMLLEYTFSTLYHALTPEPAKKVFKVLDHSGIYLFIAGSYTPFCLVTLADAHGMLLCALVWSLAVIGIALEAFWVFRPRWISALLYLLLGWCVIGWLPPLVGALPLPGLVLLASGGVCYSIGCIFYVMKKVPYMHSVFHVWVIAASVLQFLSIELYVL